MNEKTRIAGGNYFFHDSVTVRLLLHNSHISRFGFLDNLRFICCVIFYYDDHRNVYYSTI